MCIRSSETCTPCHLWDLLPACRFRQVVALQRCKYTCTTKAWRRPALYVAHEWWLPYTLCMMTIESFYCAHVAMYTSLSMCATWVPPPCWLPSPQSWWVVHEWPRQGWCYLQQLWSHLFQQPSHLLCNPSWCFWSDRGEVCGATPLFSIPMHCTFNFF